MPRQAGKWLGVLLGLLWSIDARAHASREGEHPIQVRTSQTSKAGEVQPRPGKGAWQWTTEERLARRFDPEAMKARAADQEKAQAWFKRIPVDDSEPLFSVPEKSAESPQRMLIDGRQTPELFLPWELFTSLLADAFPPGAEHAELLRRPIEERAAALGFGRDLWPRLAKVAAPLLKLETDQERLGPSPSIPTNGYELDARSLHFCRARAQAIAAAKAEFGEDPFLRLLYEALAPQVQFDYFGVDSGLADHLRFLERGCR